VRGRNLATTGPVGGLRVGDLDFDLRARREGAGPLRIVGDLTIDAATFRASEAKASSPALRAEEQVAEDLFPLVLLDIGVHTKEGKLRVSVPHLPDVSMTLDCRIQGPLRRPSVSGRAHGDGLYSRAAVFFYDVFTGSRVRRCGAR
jgi:hypothetical protein